MPPSEYSADITMWTECVLQGMRCMYVHVHAGGTGLLMNMLLQQDADVEMAAIAALAVVTAANDHNCRCVSL